MMMVSKLMDNYLAEVAPDVNLKPNKFQALAEALPEYSRLLDDGLYRAIDIYLKVSAQFFLPVYNVIYTSILISFMIGPGVLHLRVS